jgi:MoaA/NifB/PqqE/SkfB family radical SAM enzyme
MVSQPGYVGLHMADAMIRALVETLRSRELQQLCINGHGETTFVSGWHELFRPLIDEVNLSITTNLARRLAADETDFLSRLYSINVSLDTADPELLARVRYPMRLAVLVDNILRIRAAALRDRRAGPRFILYAGVYDRNVMQIEELASFALALGFHQAVFWSLVKHADVAWGLNVHTLETLGPSEKCDAVSALKRAATLLRDHGVPCEFVGDFLGVLERQTVAGLPALSEPPANRIFEMAPTRHTRDCFDPWNYVQVKANGDVHPCCAHGPVGRVAEGRGLDTVLDGESLRRLRRSLLAGDLDAECRHCHMRATVPVTEFRARYYNTFRKKPEDATPITAPPWRLQEAEPGETPATQGETTTRAADPVLLGHLDEPATGVFVAANVLVRGWFFSPSGALVRGRVMLDGTDCGAIVNNEARPDVQEAFAHLHVPRHCGFSVRIALPEQSHPPRDLSVRVDLEAAGSDGLFLGPVMVRRLQ